MSDVNEFNAETNENVLRPYTEEELEQIQLRNNKTIPDELKYVNNIGNGE